MKYKGVIFDLDGVLCHTDKFHFMAWKKIADKLGIYFDEKMNNRLRGVSRMESLAIILENYGGHLSDREKEALAEEKNDAYKEYLMQMDRTYVSCDVIKTLDMLRYNNLKLAIGSSSKNAGFILNRIGLTDYFDAICDGNGITRSKPDPEVFLKAASCLGLNIWECIVVEDARAGIDAAAAGGFACAGIGDAGEYELADYSLSCLYDLIKIME